MFCMHCGKDIADGTKFCPHCGAKVSLAIQAPAHEPVSDQHDKPSSQTVTPVQSSVPSASFSQISNDQPHPVYDLADAAPHLPLLGMDIKGVLKQMDSAKAGLAIAVVLALIIVGIGFSRVANDYDETATGDASGATSTKLSSVDKKKNPTLYSITELSGFELMTVLKNAGYKWREGNNQYWERGNKGWFLVFVEGDEHLGENDLAQLPANGEGRACSFYICATGKDYSSAKDAFKKLVNIEVLDEAWSSNNSGTAVVRGPSGRICFITAFRDDDGDYVLDVYNEEAVAAGMCETDDVKGTTISELWSNLTGRELKALDVSSMTDSGIASKTNPPKEGDIGSIGAGNYVVGEDIPAGEYKVYAREGFDGSYNVYDDDILVNESNCSKHEYFADCSYVTLSTGQYVEFQYCSLDPVSSCKPSEDYKEDSFYKVGFDLPAGTYVVTPSKDGMSGVYTTLVTTDPNADYDVMYGDGYACERINEPIEVTLNEGQYISLEGCDIKMK